MIQRVADLTEPPVVGKFYLVECISIHQGWWIPVIGEPHSDPELGAEFLHYHKDVRFLPQKSFLIMEGSRTAKVYGMYAAEMSAVPPVNSIICRSVKKLKCRRQMPEFPNVVGVEEKFPTSSMVWNKFHASYIGRKVLCGRCPHRGMNLKTLPRDADGNVICNGHGLKIDLSKEVVVKREQQVR